jgi:hypothetical protein
MSKRLPAPFDEDALLLEAGSTECGEYIQRVERYFSSKHAPPLEASDVFGLLVEGVCVHLEQALLTRGRLTFDAFPLIRAAALSAVLAALAELRHRTVAPTLTLAARHGAEADAYFEWLAYRERSSRQNLHARILPGYDTREGRLVRLWFLTRRGRFPTIDFLEEDVRAGVKGTEHAKDPRALLGGLAATPDLFLKLMWIDREGLFRIGKRQLAEMLGGQPPKPPDALAWATVPPESEPADLRSLAEPELDLVDQCRAVEQIRRARAARTRAGSVRRRVLENLVPLLREEMTQADLAREHQLDPGQVSRVLEEERVSIATELESGIWRE